MGESERSGGKVNLKAESKTTVHTSNTMIQTKDKRRPSNTYQLLMFLAVWTYVTVPSGLCWTSFVTKEQYLTLLFRPERMSVYWEYPSAPNKMNREAMNMSFVCVCFDNPHDSQHAHPDSWAFLRKAATSSFLGGHAPADSSAAVVVSGVLRSLLRDILEAGELARQDEALLEDGRRGRGVSGEY